MRRDSLVLPLLKRLLFQSSNSSGGGGSTRGTLPPSSIVFTHRRGQQKRFFIQTAADDGKENVIESELKSTCDARIRGGSSSPNSKGKAINWIVLGMPGVGKGTYAKILSKTMDIEHVSAGDLVREEIGRKTDLGKKMQNIVNSGQLLPDEMVVDAVIKKITMPKTKASERGFLLDGFPRTIAQAERLSETVPVDVVLNFTLEEAILVEKACARRKCGECGKGYNVADIDYTTKDGVRIIMPPLSPPGKCVGKMTMRDDDKEETVRARLEAFKRQSLPVEDWYRKKGMLSEFEILGGIPETTPRLMRFCLEEMKKSSA